MQSSYYQFIRDASARLRELHPDKSKMEILQLARGESGSQWFH
jgi:hypothetical protein